ncbi:MAG: alcohol dehydrogenase catalytic domain-containing protein [Planctomycetota bacterium]|jgi:(R,R)-butanediol dehydrogenase/meso-butanediol dehydrogenase/diacetyl reductase|nr:alcohol dehydrogenase catalytic domain-containing protein [Planctomycetota bacterium]
MAQAARYCGDHRFDIVDTAIPEPKADEVRLRVAHCGVCGTDMHIFHGKMDARVAPPQIIGHEMSAVVDALGSEVTGWSLGDGATVRPLRSCGSCAACDAGHSHVCQNLSFIGIDEAGAFQEYWCVPAALCHRLPTGMDLAHGALIEPVAVACHDVRRARIAPGETAAVLGAGPIGLLVAMVARDSGATVRLFEIDAGRRAMAKELGFETCDPSSADPLENVQAWTNGAGCNVVFECTAAAPCAELMTKLVGVRGRVCVVGIFPNAVPVDLFQVFWKEVEIIGARVYEAEDFERAIALAASGSLPLDRLITGRRPLAEIQQAFEQAQSGIKTLVDIS